VLDARFPETRHEDILNGVGLKGGVEDQGERETTSRWRRDPNFRSAVLMAYQFPCAVCEMNLRIGSLTIGLVAALASRVGVQARSRADVEIKLIQAGFIAPAHEVTLPEARTGRTKRAGWAPSATQVAATLPLEATTNAPPVRWQPRLPLCCQTTCRRAQPFAPEPEPEPEPELRGSLRFQVRLVGAAQRRDVVHVLMAERYSVSARAPGSQLVATWSPALCTRSALRME
jgi:hypothetical protein